MMEQVEIKLPAGKVEGFVAPKFKGVLDALVENFQAREEVGASVCLKKDGETVVDLWGGLARAKEQTPWTKDTVSVVYSCTKGATAICAHMLKSRGVLDLDAPVAELWPAFAQHGKEGVTTRMMLDHSAAVPVFRQMVKKGGLYDWDYITALLASEQPAWAPGTRNGYHGLTFAWTVGQMVRLAAKKPMGQFFAEEIAKPLGLDFWIGLPEEIEPRVAPMIPFIPPADAPRTRFMRTVMEEPQSLSSLFLTNSGGFGQGGANTREGHAAEIGSANGITNGRGLAGLYAPLSLDGGKLVDRRTRDAMGEVSMSTHDDATLLIPTRFALGFMVSMDNRRRTGEANASVILGQRAFGHVGAGGSLGFADPEAGLSFGYSMNRMGAGLLLNPRGQALVDAAYRSLGYADNNAGYWAR